MSNAYAVRIHELSDDTRARVLRLCDGIVGSHLFVREVAANRPHYQGVILSDIANQTLRQRVKVLFPECKGNKGYSVSKVKCEESYRRYLLKGSSATELPDVVSHCAIFHDDGYVAREHRAYWTTAQKPVKSNRAFVAQVAEWYGNQRLLDGSSIGKRALVEYIVQCVIEQDKGVNDFYVASVARAVLCREDPDERNIIIDNIINRI